MRFAITILLFFIYIHNSTAQQLPANAATLHYVLVPFSVGPTAKDSCIFEIAIGNNAAETAFEKNIIIRQTGLQKGTIILLPKFNTEYTWRYIDKTGKSSLHYFKIGYSVFVDSTYYRTVVIQQPAPTVNGIYVFNDYLRTLSTPAGNAVWYLPNIPGVVDDNTLVRDLKPTPQGTLTFLTNNGAYEIDYNGNILWKAPNDNRVSGNSKENYHHEFTRVTNGHYMLSGITSVERKIPAGAKTENETGNILVQYETLMEYDAAGALVWSWKGSDHIPDDIVFSKTNADGTVNTSMHLNSFYLDEKESCIYAGFRDISSIFKIQYPSGKTIAIYHGTKPGVPNVFKSQHCVRPDGKGNIYLYSNNNPGKNERISKDDKECVSSIMLLKEAKGKALSKTWEFSCDIDNNALPCTNSGGSIQLLHSDAFLVCMGSVNRNFIVTQNKNILWNAVTEKKDGDGRWMPAGTYRISCLQTPAELEALLFSTKQTAHK